MNHPALFSTEPRDLPHVGPMGGLRWIEPVQFEKQRQIQSAAAVRMAIGKGLREFSEDDLGAPMPDRIAHLLEELDRQSDDRRNTTITAP